MRASGARPRAVAAHRPGAPARERFLRLDRYRVEREWQRYEGTPQRDLFRELRARFLERHRRREGWTVDLGSGPGRFAPHLGSTEHGPVLLDLSLAALRLAREVADLARHTALVRGDALAPPLRAGRWSSVVALGNPLGFSEGRAGEFLERTLPLVAPGGTFLLEVVCGPGETSRYLSRLPPGAVRRLLVAPVNLVRSRVAREGFHRGTPRRPEGSAFRRYDPSEIRHELEGEGFDVLETLAVAPCLGLDVERIAAVRPDALAWLHLLELEEAVGRLPQRQGDAAALLIAARRRAPSPAGASD